MYKRTLRMAIAVALLSGYAVAQTGPRVTGVEPATFSSGATVNVMGEGLQDGSLEGFSLFREGMEYPLEIIEQTATNVTVRVPEVAPSTYSIAIKIQGVTYTEPVEVTVE